MFSCINCQENSFTPKRGGGYSSGKTDLRQHKLWKVKTLVKWMFTPTLCSLDCDSSMMNNVRGNAAWTLFCKYQNTSAQLVAEVHLHILFLWGILSWLWNNKPLFGSTSLNCLLEMTYWTHCNFKLYMTSSFLIQNLLKICIITATRNKNTITSWNCFYSNGG